MCKESGTDDAAQPERGQYSQDGRAEKKGLLLPAGVAAYAKRKKSKSRVHGYEKEQALSKDYDKRLKADKKAWTFFSVQPPSYQKIVRNWIMSAKRESTREYHLAKLIEFSARRQRIY